MTNKQHQQETRPADAAVSPWASDAEIESFIRGETPPELRDYLAAGISEKAARQPYDAGCSAEFLLCLLGR